jgi:RimJ/RimL family protein N-acetyltransferase
MITYCFTQLRLFTLTADVNIENRGSVKILEKFFDPIREFYNEDDNCTDRRYMLRKEKWLTSQQQ